MDCEMVGVGAAGRQDILARCSIVNRDGDTVLDSFGALLWPLVVGISTTAPSSFAHSVGICSGAKREGRGLSNTRQWCTTCGFTQRCVANACAWTHSLYSLLVAVAPSFEQVQTRVADLLKGRVLIGHSVHHDLKVGLRMLISATLG
jgi:RNA exonuclease 4